MPKSKIPAQNIIGVFDSGLGGLAILKYFLTELPDYNYIYLGDNARLPYGGKSQATIYEYTREAMDFLFDAGCNLIVIACNTASAQALRRLQQEYLPTKYPDRKILGVIRPLVEYVGQQKNNQTVGLIGTKATINSQAYTTELRKINPTIRVISQSTPLLVPLIEEAWTEKPETKMILKKYLRPLRTKKIDTLILGCTHYPLLHREIQRIVGRRITVPQPGEIIADRLKDYLSRHPELGIQPVKNPSVRYCSTDKNELFWTLGRKLLGPKFLNLEQVKISR